MSEATESQPHESVNPERDREYQRLVDACSDGEPILIILRVHLLTEFYLERLIHTAFKRPDKLLEDGGLTYAQKLAIVAALELIPDVTISCLKNLNKIRNKCSHEMMREISVADITTFGSPLGKDFTRIRRENEDSLKDLLVAVCIIICATCASYVSAIEAFGEKKPNQAPEPTAPSGRGSA